VSPSVFRQLQTFAISPNDFVVEVGSGNAPNWRCDLLVDKCVVESSERPGRAAPLLIDRAFIVGDALRLPFANRSIDFLMARHILEHIVDVDVFASEMMRVTRRGYVMTPSPLVERLFGWQKQVWIVRMEDNRLVLQAKARPLYDWGLWQLTSQVRGSTRGLVSRNRIPKATDGISRLACPLCRGRLESRGDGLCCANCAVRYPMVDDVPIPVAEAGSRA
jgi:hypothetical protein